MTPMLTFKAPIRAPLSTRAFDRQSSLDVVHSLQNRGLDNVSYVS